MCNKFCTIKYFKYSGNQAPLLWGNNRLLSLFLGAIQMNTVGFTFHLGICSTVVLCNALRHVGLFVCLWCWRRIRQETEGTQTNLKKAKEFVDIPCLSVFCWEKLEFDMAPECLSAHLLLSDGGCSERFWEQWVQAGTFLFVAVWKCSWARRGSCCRYGGWCRNALSVPVTVAWCGSGYLWSLSLLCLYPVCSVSSKLKFQSALSKQTGLSWSWQPVHVICFCHLLSGCSWIAFSNILCNWGSSVLPQRCTDSFPLDARGMDVVQQKKEASPGCLQFSEHPKTGVPIGESSWVWAHLRGQGEWNEIHGWMNATSQPGCCLGLLLKAFSLKFCFSSVNVHRALCYFLSQYSTALQWPSKRAFRGFREVEISSKHQTRYGPREDL